MVNLKKECAAAASRIVVVVCLFVFFFFLKTTKEKGCRKVFVDVGWDANWSGYCSFVLSR